MESVLRPRDIQARIRAGEAPEEVAAAAQTSVDRIMGFATPVLAERAYQAQLAQRASVRRRAASGQVSNLGGAVTAHLETIDVDPESVQWDSWRREDGRWTVVACYVARGDQRRASFAYDAAGRFVVAEDDEARTLVGERTTPPPEPSDLPRRMRLQPGVETSAWASLEPGSPAEEGHEGHQIPIGDDALEVVMGLSSAPTTRPEEAPPLATRGPALAADEVTIDLTETSDSLRTRSGHRPNPDADWISTQASERPAPAATVEPDAPQPDGAPASDPWDTPGDDETVEEDAREEEQEESEALFEVPTQIAAAATGSESATPAADRGSRSSKSRRRASVPTWDEIMFGTPSSSD